MEVAAGVTESRLPPARLRSGDARWAAWAFAAILVIAGTYLIVWPSREMWFVADEWAFLAPADSTNIWSPHLGHWVTIPRLAWKAMMGSFGLESYTPYLAAAVVAHLAVAVMLRVIMRRAGVPPWGATLMASAILLFGPGSLNMTFAFQLTMTLAAALGLGQVVMADHDGLRWGRDCVALTLGLLATMTSGVGLLMAAATGVAVLGRRGWRWALLQTVPLALIYGAWRIWTVEPFPDPAPELWRLPSWLAESMWGAFASLGAGSVIALVAALVALYGAIQFGISSDRSRQWSIVGMACVVPLFALSTWRTRQGYERIQPLEGEIAASSRYLYVYAVLLLPLLAWGATLLCRRYRLAIVLIPLAMLAVTVNAMSVMPDRGNFQLAQLFRTTLPAVPAVSGGLAPDTPVLPPLGLGYGVTVGFLREQSASGQLPEANSIRENAALAWIALRQTAGARPSRCRIVPRGGRITADVFWISGNTVSVSVRQVASPSPPGLRALQPGAGQRVERISPDALVEVDPSSLGDVCVVR